MNDILKNAMRKEAFVQGHMRAKAESLGKPLRDFDDATLLSWLPGADAAFVEYRKGRDS